MSKDRKRRINDDFLATLTDISANRNGMDQYYQNFLLNSGRTISFTDSAEKGSDELTQQYEERIIEHSIVFLISTWETFFRDICVFLINEIKEISVRAECIIGSDKLGEVEKLGIKAEYYSKLYNYQNIDEIRSSFLNLLNCDVFEEVGNHIIPYIEDEQVYKFNMNVSINDWFLKVMEVFEERHKIIHDANYRTKYKINDIKKIENILLCFPQIFCIWLSEKYSSKFDVMRLNTKNGWISRESDENLKIPFLVNRKRILGKWYIKD